MRQHRPWGPGTEPYRNAGTMTALDRRRIAHPLAAVGGSDAITGESP
jgi:hypothetical protein